MAGRWKTQTSKTTSSRPRCPRFSDPCNRPRTTSHICTNSATPSWNEQNSPFYVNSGVRNALSTDAEGLHCRISKTDSGRFALWLFLLFCLARPRHWKRATYSRQQGKQGKAGDAMRMTIRTILIVMILSWIRQRQRSLLVELLEQEECVELPYRRKQR